ncbi:receptor-like protein kinase [Seminavis robusta]|uniref:Receptor-like protein kinase n=1 Tax=Seminavis robusta TaxID=568900 RepID=A0A9N8EDL4_9STRA|nr:receptor-like protein kinase [Seminavis robusta]|eukprot:Sro848_g210460.1 receptor-like protein kinase (741) ;mRNA; r:26781-29003
MDHESHVTPSGREEARYKYNHQPIDDRYRCDDQNSLSPGDYPEQPLTDNDLHAFAAQELEQQVHDPASADAHVVYPDALQFGQDDQTLVSNVTDLHTVEYQNVMYPSLSNVPDDETVVDPFHLAELASTAPSPGDRIASPPSNHPRQQQVHLTKPRPQLEVLTEEMEDGGTSKVSSVSGETAPHVPTGGGESAASMYLASNTSITKEAKRMHAESDSQQHQIAISNTKEKREFDSINKPKEHPQENVLPSEDATDEDKVSSKTSRAISASINSVLPGAFAEHQQKKDATDEDNVSSKTSRAISASINSRLPGAFAEPGRPRLAGHVSTGNDRMAIGASSNSRLPGAFVESGRPRLAGPVSTNNDPMEEINPRETPLSAEKTVTDDPASREVILTGWVPGAVPNTNDNQEASHAKPERNMFESWRNLFIVLLCLVVVPATFGGVCGSGLCGAQGADTPTMAPTSVYYSELQMAISNALGEDYFNPKDDDKAAVRYQALDWIVRDSAQLPLVDNFVQRYILAVFLYQTSQEQLWRRCNGDNGDLCYDNDSALLGRSWLDPASHECQWGGIVCGETSSQVIGLTMATNSLNGPLPTELALLPKLRVLNLAGNQLTGPMPSEFYRLTALQELNLSGNALGGSIRTEIGLLTSLSKLDVSSNDFVGKLPEEVSALTALYQFDISKNPGISGKIPQSMCDNAYSHINREDGIEIRADCANQPSMAIISCPEGCCTECCSEKLCYPA